MRIAFVKLSDTQHALELVRARGRRERVVCETRSYLLHDFMHLAVESEARLTSGFWGKLAAGTTLAEMNDRTRSSGPDSAELVAIEQLVGALHGATKRRAPGELVARLRLNPESLAVPLPDWLTEELVVRVQARLRRLTGQWKATPYGGSLEVEWAPGVLVARRLRARSL
jgi:hypothetical protein